MNSKEYMEHVRRTSSLNFNLLNKRILHGAMGTATESGELLDAVKKSLYYNQVLDCLNIKEEIGDVLHYLTMICDEIDYTFGEAMNDNVEKLKIRYPEQFSDVCAIDRVDKTASEVIQSIKDWEKKGGGEGKKV